MDKGKLLIESLPYIKKFKGKTFVVKFGGSMFQNEILKDLFIKDVALLSLVGINVVLVHGGGKDINYYLKKMNMEEKFIDGYRVTDDPSMDIVEMVLSGKVNKDICSRIVNEGIKAIGISGRDNGLIIGDRMNGPYGNVGEIKIVNTKVIEDLLDMDYIPVVSPVAEDESGNALNINGDTAASNIASALNAEKLILVTDVDGLYKDYKDKDSLISYIDSKLLKKLVDEEKLSGAIKPKAMSAVEAVEDGVKNVHIINGNEAHSIILEVFLENGFGTMVGRNENE
ncbi:MAG: acetylglutamate kinase [Firmicutes bacterium]|jgi:acetylglutamate kinase|nr:acetylglutamate kinase [Bacillota bacterium]